MPWPTCETTLCPFVLWGLSSSGAVRRDSHDDGTHSTLRRRPGHHLSETAWATRQDPDSKKKKNQQNGKAVLRDIDFFPQRCGFCPCLPSSVPREQPSLLSPSYSPDPSSSLGDGKGCSPACGLHTVCIFILFYILAHCEIHNTP